MGSQFKFFCVDVQRILRKKKYRILSCWFSRSFVGILLYRLERSIYLLIGESYKILRIPLLPLYSLMQVYSNIDIHYRASIGPGISILHPSMGIVISGRSIIGKHLTLVGGNVIGVGDRKGDYILGDFIHLGANATIIGPLVLGSHCQIGAAACVTKSFLSSNIILVGVPAKVKINETT